MEMVLKLTETPSFANDALESFDANPLIVELDFNLEVTGLLARCENGSTLATKAPLASVFGLGHLRELQALPTSRALTFSFAFLIGFLVSAQTTLPSTLHVHAA